MQYLKCLRPLSRSKLPPISSSSNPRYFSAVLQPFAVDVGFAEEPATPSSSKTVSASRLPATHHVPTSQLSPTSTIADAPSSSKWHPPESAVKQYTALCEILHQRHASSPSEVYARYVAAQLATGHQLPYGTQQQVLRRCVPPIQVMASDPFYAGRGTWRRKISDEPHALLTDRLLAVLKGMRLAGHTPRVDDYNFVMTHFVGSGHYLAAVKLLTDMVNEGMQPDRRTIDVCFRALSAHASLWAPPSRREDRKVAAVKVLKELLALSDAPWSSSALDATIHVYALYDDWEGIERVLKLGFGIDLANPDRHPPEFIERMKRLAEAAAEAGTEPPTAPCIRTPLLNALLVVLGRRGEISKMVTAFATITSPLPLPPHPSSSQDYGFDEVEDDEPVFHDHLHPLQSTLHPEYLTPARSPEPNTETYRLLIKYAMQHSKLDVAKHFLRAAMDDEHDANAKLRSTDNGPLRRPAVGTASLMFAFIAEKVPRTDTETVKWLHGRLGLTIRRKLRYMQRLHQRPSSQDSQAIGSPPLSPSFAYQEDSLMRTPENTPFDRKLHRSILNKELSRLVRLRKIWDAPPPAEDNGEGLEEGEGEEMGDGDVAGNADSMGLGESQVFMLSEKPKTARTSPVSRQRRLRVQQKRRRAQRDTD